MAGPYTGTWRAQATSLAEYTGASKWGTGINPVHSIPGEGPALQIASKLNIDPVTTPGGQETDVISEDYSWDSTYNPDPTLPAYDVTDASIWGAGDDTGTADRAPWGTGMSDSDSPVNGVGLPNPTYAGRPLAATRGKTQNATDSSFPSWGGSRKPGPAGRLIRAIRRGSDMTTAARVLPNEDVAQGWTNKTHGIAADSRPADDSQLLIQTSMIQRYKQRAGSQRSASQSEYSAPIDSRVTGQKVKTWTRPDSARHWDMLPYEQQDYARPFLSRQAGTGYREWMYPNDMYVSPAIQREPAPDPALGPIAGSADDYGYATEDSGVYY
jgi:hypothetical protein